MESGHHGAKAIELGYEVVGYDVDAAKIESLNTGVLPIHEPGLPELLKNLLGPGRAIRLESLRTVPAVQVQSGAELYRHGLEMTLRGSYFDLMQYLSDLEKMPARLLWGGVELQVDKYPEVRLSVQVHTLSTQRSLGL